MHYSGRTRRTMAFVEELAQLHGERLCLYVSDEGTRNDFGALSVDEHTRVYACGTARMLDALEAANASWPEDALRIEHFTASAGKLDPANERAFEVEL